MSMSTLQLVNYYSNLLIGQYRNLPAAQGTINTTVTPVLMAQTSIQVISFSAAPTSGSFILNYNGNASASIAYNANNSVIQTTLQAVPGLGSVSVTGSINSTTGLTVLFTGVVGVAYLLSSSSNTLLNNSAKVNINIAEIDLTLPLAVQNAFGLGSATGVQLDVIGEYAGVTRTTNTPTGPITLDDTDFTTLIRFAIVQNISGSDMATIQSNFQKFFPGQFLITDYREMRMSYVFTTAVGSANFFTFIQNEGLLPVPMGVQVSVVIVPSLYPYFSCSTYNWLNTVGVPLNTYSNYNKNYLVLVPVATTPPLYPWMGCSTYSWLNIVGSPLNNYVTFNPNFFIATYADGLSP